jgi:RNA polymerase subunit RPABC4/transcription elongation factor Spt4
LTGLPAAVLAQADPFQFIGDILNSPILRIGGQLILLLFAALWIALVYWTYTDAARRGALKFFWGIVAVIFPFIGTLIYLIVRPPEFVLDTRERELELAVLERELRNRVLLCPNCRAIVERDFIVCPECHWELKKPCVHCEKPMNMEWETCPFCGTEQRSGKQTSW